MYHGPNLLDRSSVVNLGNVRLPRFTFGCFYCTPGFGWDDSAVFHIGGRRLLFDCFECLSSVSYSSFALIVKPVSCFTDLFLLLGMVA